MKKCLGSEPGHVLIEALVLMPVVALLLAGLFKFSALGVTKYMVDLAGFAAARTLMLYGGPPGPPSSYMVSLDELAKAQVGWPAAWQVLDNMQWWRQADRNRPDFPLGISFRCPDGRRSLACAPFGRKVLTVTYRVPIGNSTVRVMSATPYVIQHSSGSAYDDIEERGDNAAP
jgi:hypothetical protein